MKRRSLAAAASAVFAMSLLAGCSQTADEASKENAVSKEDTVSKEEQVSKEDEAAKAEPADGKSADLYVFIAASLANAMDEIKQGYNQLYPNVNILYNPDSSGTLQTQIEEGAQCDIFFSAAVKQMNALTEGGFAQEANVVNLLENKVVLIKPAGGQTEVTGFANVTDAVNLALAGEDVPVGQYARKIFDKLNITDKVMAMEINEGANVTAILTAVSEQSNEVGVVYATDAASMKDLVEIIAEAEPNEQEEAVIYPVGLISNEQATAAQSQAAQTFMEYLQTQEAAAVFTEYGFSMYQ